MEDVSDARISSPCPAQCARRSPRHCSDAGYLCREVMVSVLEMNNYETHAKQKEIHPSKP
jgi:hypothetical protein